MEEAIPERLREQARWCRTLGSPLCTEILERAAEDFAAGGPTATVLAGHESDPPTSMLGIRLLAALHRLVLEGRAPRLARFYPTGGGNPARPGL